MSAVIFAAMLTLMFLGLHIAVAMFAVAVVAAAVWIGPAAVHAVGTQIWAATEDPLLLSIPLYILLGELLVRGGSTDKMYGSLSDWFGRMPGGLLHSNIAASAMFSAVSGSSVATAATISTVALPNFRQQGYDPRLVLGSIAAGASLGNLIPPGIAFLIYGAMTNTSAGRLYAAGMVPGLLMALLFLLTIYIIARARPGLTGARPQPLSLRDKLRRSRYLAGPTVIFVVVMGAIYTGWATVTESAAIGVMLAVVFCALYGTLSVGLLHDAFRATMRLTAMSILILSVAFYLNFVLSQLGVAQALSRVVGGMEVSPIVLLWCLAVFYFLLGIFFETLPMLVGTVPILFPIVAAAGIDPILFGVFIVLMTEMSLLSPPVGMTLYVIQAVRGEGSIREVFAGTLPFLAAMILMTAVLIHVPAVALWLPSLMFGR
ncbi:TRAP transporter large permease [Verticiella sediminum]|uniref:TRAP transporter large permease protein n=2 Tax=Verticiella sediminum TaxID=1247510 RepID=A0A556AZ12_9BURK|nr:TRAP transporter large permease [Verticiella sediminum]